MSTEKETLTCSFPVSVCAHIYITSYYLNMVLGVLDDYVIVLLSGVALHLLNCSAEHAPVHHILLHGMCSPSNLLEGYQSELAVPTDVGVPHFPYASKIETAHFCDWQGNITTCIIGEALHLLCCLCRQCKCTGHNYSERVPDWV